MYVNGATERIHLQDLAFSTDKTNEKVCIFPSPYQGHGMGSMEDPQEPDDDFNEFDATLDPLGERVLRSVKAILSTSSKTTIKEVSDSVGVGESAVRKRLSHLVNLNLLKCDQGTGRTPSYYYLPSASTTTTESNSSSMLTDEQLLEHFKQKEVGLRKQLEEIQRNREALERVIELKRNFKTEQ